MLIILQIFLLQVVQLLETPLVNLINYPSLVATNAARHRFVAGKSKMLLEFGLRRAQVAVFFPLYFEVLLSIYLHKKDVFVLCIGT